jgi:hypothetical protein
MTLCPIALAVGCQKCPAFKVCPVKSIIGDMPKVDDTKPVAAAKPKTQSRTPAKTKAKPKK